METWEKIGKKINDLGQDAVKKAKDLADMARLSVQISTQEDVVKNNLIGIGRLYCDLFNENPHEGFEIFCENISAAQEKINEMRAELMRLKGIKVCHECGKEISRDSIFCAFCGAETGSEDLGTVERSPDKCLKCETKIDNNMVFCPKCGERIKE